MGHSQADKAGSRERILKQAAAQIRESGLESLSVNKLMRSVDLTHGGFYGHFSSRSELVAQALERALEESQIKSRATVGSGKARSFATMVKSYLSRAHRDAPQAGCALATLATDVARADEPARAVVSGHIDGFIANIAQALLAEVEDGADASAGEDADTAGADAQAMVALSAMVGALTLSRVMTDPRRSDALLRAVREHVVGLGPGAGTSKGATG